MFGAHHGIFSTNAILIKNSPGMVQRAMAVEVTKVKWQFARIYLDKMVIFSQPLDEHIDHIQQVPLC